MTRKLGLRIFAAALWLAAFAGAAAAEQDKQAGKGSVGTIVYLVLMAGSPPLHLIEMPSMEKCEAAARHAANAKCITSQAVDIDELKSKVGGVDHLRRLPARPATERSRK